MKKELKYSSQEIEDRGLRDYVEYIIKTVIKLDNFPNSKRIAGDVCSASTQLLQATGLWPQLHFLPAERYFTVINLATEEISKSKTNKLEETAMEFGFSLYYRNFVSLFLEDPVSALTCDAFRFMLPVSRGVPDYTILRAFDPDKGFSRQPCLVMVDSETHRLGGNYE